MRKIVGASLFLLACHSACRFLQPAAPNSCKWHKEFTPQTALHQRSKELEYGYCIPGSPYTHTETRNGALLTPSCCQCPGFDRKAGRCARSSMLHDDAATGGEACVHVRHPIGPTDRLVCKGATRAAVIGDCVATACELLSRAGRGNARHARQGGYSTSLGGRAAPLHAQVLTAALMPHGINSRQGSHVNLGVQRTCSCQHDGDEYNHLLSSTTSQTGTGRHLAADNAFELNNIRIKLPQPGCSDLMPVLSALRACIGMHDAIRRGYVNHRIVTAS